MERQRLFDLTVRKLQRIVATGDEFDMLDAAAAIRKLLLDDTPLLHQVNRQRRRRVTFQVERPSALQRVILEDQPVVYFLLEGLSPMLTITASAGVDSLTLDQFLAWAAAWVRGEPISVKDLVLQVAHVEGGVHAGNAKTDVQVLLQDAGSVARTMRGIADVVVLALEPLVVHQASEGSPSPS